MLFLNSASSAAALVFYLPALCTQTDTEGKQSSEYFEKLGKTQYLMNTLYKKAIHLYKKKMLSGSKNNHLCLIKNAHESPLKRRAFEFEVTDIFP